MNVKFSITDNMRSKSKKVAAMAYARAGYPVLALYGTTNGKCDCGKSDCKGPGKHPIGREFPNGFKDATTDVKAIESIFTKYPNANIGLVPTGNLLVADIDGPLGEASISAASLPETTTVKTGKGRHLYLHCEGLEGWKPPKLKGVDFRCNENGYIVAPPSRHVNGAVYEWGTTKHKAAMISPAVFKATRSITLDLKNSSRSAIEQGERNNELASIAGILRANNIKNDLAAATLQAINQTMCSPPLPRKEIERIAHSIARYPSAIEKAFADMASVKVEDVSWLYSPYIPRGAITTLDGRPGLGKSNLCAALVAALTTGGVVPWSRDKVRGKALLLSAEDDAARVLKPRLIANEAKVEAGTIRFAKDLFALNEAGISLLKAEVASFRPDLVIIDPIVAFMGAGADLNKATDMTRFMSDIDKIAREYDCAVLIVRHNRKSGDGDAMMQGIGSVAIVGRARSQLVMGKHPGNPDVKAVGQAKSNYGKEGPVFTFTLKPKNNVPVVHWLGIDDNLTADQISQGPKQDGPGRPSEEGEAAVLWLKDFLGDGERSSGEVFRQAEKRSFTEITIRRASEKIGVIKERKGVPSFWRLPEC